MLLLVKELADNDHSTDVGFSVGWSDSNVLEKLCAWRLVLGQILRTPGLGHEDAVKLTEGL